MKRICITYHITDEETTVETCVTVAMTDENAQDILENQCRAYCVSGLLSSPVKVLLEQLASLQGYKNADVTFILAEVAQ